MLTAFTRIYRQEEEAEEEKKRILLDLNLQVVVSHHGGAGN